MDTHPRPVCPQNPMRSVVPVKMRKELVDPDMQKELLHLSHGWSLKPHGFHRSSNGATVWVFLKKAELFFKTSNQTPRKYLESVWFGTPNFQN